MAQDIREMFRQEEDSQEKAALHKGHLKRFESRLDRELPQQRSRSGYFYWRVAAIVVVALGVGFFLLNEPVSLADDVEIVDTPQQETPVETVVQKKFQLSDVSPEFKKIENYYMAGINMELAKLEINNDNKALIDAFMLELEELDKEYQRLNAELNESGPNEQTIEAMIANLQLRLELLLKLKNKLKELKQSKNYDHENLQA